MTECFLCRLAISHGDYNEKESPVLPATKIISPITVRRNIPVCDEHFNEKMRTLQFEEVTGLVLK